MSSELTPERWERLICSSLEVAAPVRSRWLQEHPQRTEIVRELVEEAADTLAQVNDPDEGTTNPVFWASIPPAERGGEVVAMMIDSVELWAEITRYWPNPPPPLEPPPAGPIPASGPTRRGWSPPG